MKQKSLTTRMRAATWRGSGCSWRLWQLDKPGQPMRPMPSPCSRGWRRLRSQGSR